MKDYQIIEKIAEGGMGSIYKAFQPSLERTVCLKKLRSGLADKNLLVRFKQEAKIIAQLTHPNIVHIYDYGWDEDAPYLVMEYIDGVSVDKYKEIPFEICVMIIREIGEALKYAHQQGIVHRDLKPANILLSKQGIVKLTDFGIAAFIKRSRLEITQRGSFVGTPLFISPEQATGKKIDPRSDIFSLGAVFYTILTSQPPFMAEEVNGVLYKIVHGEYQKLQEVKPSLPWPIIEIVERCLKTNPTERYQKVEELIKKSNEFLQKLGLVNVREELELFVRQPAQYHLQAKTEKIENFLQKGEDFVRKREIAAALQEYQKVLEIDPVNEIALTQIEKLGQGGKTSLATTLSSPHRKFSARFSGWWRTAYVFLFGIFFLYFFFFFRNYQEELRRYQQITHEQVSKLKELREKKKEKEFKISLTTRKFPSGRIKERGGAEKQEIVPARKVEKKREERKVIPPEKEKEKKIQFGKIYIFSHPYSDVFINGEKVGRAPFSKPLLLPVGKYQVKLITPQGDRYETEVKIKPGKVTRLRKHFIKKEEK